MENKVKFKNKIIFRSSTTKFSMDSMANSRKFPPFSPLPYYPFSFKNTTSKLQSYNKALVIDMCWNCILKVLQMTHLCIKFLEWTLINTWDIFNHVFESALAEKKGVWGNSFPQCICTYITRYSILNIYKV